MRWRRFGQEFCLSPGRLRESPDGWTDGDRLVRTPYPRTAVTASHRRAGRTLFPRPGGRRPPARGDQEAVCLTSSVASLNISDCGAEFCPMSRPQLTAQELDRDPRDFHDDAC